MGYNNTMYRLFQEMLDGYATDSDGLFEHGVRCMMDLNPKNPFNDNTPEAELFFQMYNTYCRWKNHGADMKINRRRMLAAATELCGIVTANPYTFSKEEEQLDLKELREKEELKKKEEERIAEQKKQEELAKQEAIRKLEEKRKQEQIELEKTKNISDPKVAMVAMVNAFNVDDEVTYNQAVTQLMSISTENPFAPRTEEYDVFLEMMTAYHNKNMRRVFVVGRKLCEIINSTDVIPEKETILGVVPDEEKEKKNWLKFLFPWRKEK